MPLELQIIRASEFVRLGAQGHFDLAASKLALAQVAGACLKRGLNCALLDLRALRPGPKPVFSSTDLLDLVNTFRQVGLAPNHRLAILYHSDPHHRARLFAFLSTMRGWKVQAFGEYEDAILWLSRGEESSADAIRPSSAKKIPVRNLKHEACPPSRPKAKRARKSR